MNGKLTWNGDKVLAEVKAKAWESLLRAAEFYMQKCREAVSISNPRVPVRRKHDTSVRWMGKATKNGGPIGSRYNTYPNPGVRPGPPHTRTGAGRKGIEWEKDKAKGTIRVGVIANVRYMAFLQVRGWDWMLSTLKAHWDTIKGLAQAE
jgi:hypothetical protein